MKNVYDTLMERGFIEQATHEEEIRELLERDRSHFISGLTQPQIACMSGTSFK